MGRYDSDSGIFSAEEFKNRGVIKLAPDALVYVGSSLGTTVIAPVDGKNQSLNFQDGITSISVQSNIDPPGSSTATIEIATPIYDSNQTKYWIEFGDKSNYLKTPYFIPMMEVQIYFRGRFLVGDKMQYYPSFWGFITNVEENFSGGMYKIQLQCADILHWWQYIQVAFRPSAASSIAAGANNQPITYWGSKYEGAGPFEIIWALTQDMGMSGFITPSWVGKFTPNNISSSPQLWNEIYKNISSYWANRFSQSVNLLRMFGSGGNLIATPENSNPQTNAPDPKTSGAEILERSLAIIKNSYSTAFDLDNVVGSFPIFGAFADMKGIEQAEYMTKLEIATEVKNRVEYEFFQDVNGNFIFKPPFYNMDTRPLLPYVIKPHDIINYSSAVNSEEIVTALEVQLTPMNQVQSKDFINTVGYFIDIDLAQQYGFRQKQINSWYLHKTDLAYAYAAGETSLINAKAHTGSITIPGRPELKLGYPVYIEHRDIFFYVKSINHTFDYGGSFTTNLSLEAKREKVFSYNELTKQWGLQTGSMLPIIGPGMGTVYRFNPDKIKNPTMDTQAKTDEKNKSADKAPTEQTDPNVLKQEMYQGSGMFASLQPGFYDIRAQMSAKESTITNLTVPFTDSNGFRVVGAFNYGRDIILRPGIVPDERTMELTLKSGASTEVPLERMTQMVLSIGTASDEAKFMSTYFKGQNNQGSESAINGYLGLRYMQGSTSASIANQANQTYGPPSPISPKVVASAYTTSKENLPSQVSNP